MPASAETRRRRQERADRQGWSGWPTREDQMRRLRDVILDAQFRIRLLERLPDGAIIRASATMWECEGCRRVINKMEVHVEDVRGTDGGRFAFRRGKSKRYCLECGPGALAEVAVTHNPKRPRARRIVVLAQEGAKDDAP